MKKLIKKILEEETKLLNEAPVLGAKVTAVICTPLPNEWSGPWVDPYFIRIYQQGVWVTPQVGDYMISTAVRQTTGAFMGYKTSWRIISIQAYGTVEGDREGYHKCELDRPGCMDPLACNFKPYAQINVDDGSCVYPGCDDPNAANYDPTLVATSVSNNHPTLNDCACDGVDNYGRPDCCEYPGCTIPGNVNYDPMANVNDGSCVLPTTYSCSDGQCHLDVNGPHATIGECLVECSDCTHNECWYCPGLIQTQAPNDFLQHELSEKVQTTSTKQGCKVAGSQWLQILTSGTYLYATKADCETAESDCSSEDDTTPVQTEQCHCCQTIAGGGTSPYIITGPNGQAAFVAVGKCNEFEIGNSYTPTGVPNPTTIYFTSGLSDCRPITQPLPCEGTNVVGTLELKKGENKEKGKEEKTTSDIREDIRKMKKIIK